MSTPNRMNTQQFEQAIAEKANLSEADANRFLTALRDVVAQELAAGGSIAVTNFGTWLAVQRPTRKARNPQTGETVTVEGFQGVKWRTSPRLADIVRTHDTTATTRKHPSRPQPTSEQPNA